jgi:hypothetical protein
MFGDSGFSADISKCAVTIISVQGTGRRLVIHWPNVCRITIEADYLVVFISKVDVVCGVEIEVASLSMSACLAPT